MADKFWATIAAQLTELESARSADDVFRILAGERNPYGPAHHASMIAGGAEGFFAGSGGNDTVWDALSTAGWNVTWSEAEYYFVAQAPDGSVITYVEGDVYRGDRH
jgi:hypothetical protein